MSIIKQEFGSFQDMATQHMLAPILQNLVNTTGAVISAGSYFIFNNELYKATADIAANATIVVGTNAAAAKTVTEELIQRVDDVAIAYKEIYVSAGGKTWLDQIKEIETKYDNLTPNEKKHSVLIESDYYYNVVSPSRKEFSFSLQNTTKMIITSIKMNGDSSYLVQGVTAISGGSVVFTSRDYTNETHSGTLTLALI